MALSPIIPAILSFPVVWGFIAFSGHPWPSEEIGRHSAEYLFAVEAWALIVGLAGPGVMFRCTDRLGRSGCLLLVAIGAFALPFAYFVFNEPRFEFGLIGFVGLIGLFAVPFGLLGGWIFWRIAVHPASSR
jgi:hypothetical protein